MKFERHGIRLYELEAVTDSVFLREALNGSLLVIAIPRACYVFAGKLVGLSAVIPLVWCDPHKSGAVTSCVLTRVRRTSVRVSSEIGWTWLPLQGCGKNVGDLVGKSQKNGVHVTACWERDPRMSSRIQNSSRDEISERLRSGTRSASVCPVGGCALVGKPSSLSIKEDERR